MESIFEDKLFNKLFNNHGGEADFVKAQIKKTLVVFGICWLPLALLTALEGSFWTGDAKTSFITNFDTQIRYLVSLPIFIMAERMVSVRLRTIMAQFKNSGIVKKEQFGALDQITDKNRSFLSSKWLDLAVFTICYIQVILILIFEKENAFMLTWQIHHSNQALALSSAGWWNFLIGRPLVLFLFYRWIIAIIAWGFLLRKISKLDLNLFPLHPDCVGGLGFLGYGIRYFSPITFAISASVSGSLIDMILIEDMSLSEIKIPVIGFFILITFLFTYPLLWFTKKLIDAREKSVFDNDDYANGMLREFKVKISKKYHEVNHEDLQSPVYSSVSDLSSIMNNALNMKFLPLSLKDLVPLWVSIIIPILFVISMEIPINQLLREVLSLMM